MVVKRRTAPSQKKSSTKQVHFVVLLWGVVKMLARTFSHHIRGLWYLNPIHVINRRHQRMYFIDDNGLMPIKPRWLERMMDLFRSDAKRKKLLLSWLKKKIPYQNISNFSSSWNDGISLCALMESVRPGVCPDYQDMQHHNIITNCRLGIKLAQNCLNLPQNMITPEEMAIADRRTEQKMFHFICAIKWRSDQSYPEPREVVPSLEVPLKCHVRGSGLSTGVTGRRARFTFHATDISRIQDLIVHIKGPRHDEYCERIINLLNFNFPSNTKYLINKKTDLDETQQISSKVYSTKQDLGYLDDGFGNMFLRVKDFERTVKRNCNTNTISLSCQCNGRGTFLFTFVPIFAGIHTISIKTATQHVGDSPYKVKVYQPCDLKQRNMNDTNDKLLVSMSFSSLDEQNKNNSNCNGKSPRKSERILKRQFTIRKKRVLRKVITKNGEEISILDSPSIPAFSRETSINTDSDTTEEEARRTWSDMCSDSNFNPSEAKNHESVKRVETEVGTRAGPEYHTESLPRNRTKSETLHPNSNMCCRETEKLPCHKESAGNKHTIPEMNINSTDQHSLLPVNSQQFYNLSCLDSDFSITETQDHLHGCKDTQSHDNVISRRGSLESTDSTCGVVKLNAYSDQLLRQSSGECNNKTRCHRNLSSPSSTESIDNPSVFPNISQVCYTTPSTPASEKTSSTCGDVTSSLSNFSLFSYRIDDASPCSSVYSGNDDNPNSPPSQPQERNGYSINDESVSPTTANITCSAVSGNKVPASALSTDLAEASPCVESINNYRLYISAENSAEDSFMSAFSKPITCSEQSSFDSTRLTDDGDLLKKDHLHIDKYRLTSPQVQEIDNQQAAVGQDRYLHHWLDSQRPHSCNDDQGVAPEQTIHTNLSILPIGAEHSDSYNTERIALPGQKVDDRKAGPIPVIGILGASLSEASVPDIAKTSKKCHDIEWRDSKYDEIIRRKSDTAINNQLPNTTLMMFRTIPSFESALGLPSNMNIVVPIPHREKCTQVTENEILEATGWTLRISCLKLIRKRICIKINSEENIENELKKDNCASSINETSFDKQTAHNTKELVSRAAMPSPDFRATLNNEELRDLYHTERRTIRQSTTDTVDSGIADDNLKPSTGVSIGVDTKRRSLNGHRLVYRRPYRGIIRLDPKLVRSNSTPDSSIDEERRYYKNPNDFCQVSDTKGVESLPGCAATRRKYLRHLRKGQSFSLSDSDLQLSGLLTSKFDPEYPSLAKTAEKVCLLHRFVQSGKSSNENEDHNRENKENVDRKQSYRIGTTGTSCNSEQTSESEAGCYSDDINNSTTRNLCRNDIETLQKYPNNSQLSPTRGLRLQTQFYDLNDWNIETGNVLNEASFDSLTSSVQSLDDSYRGFGVSKCARSIFLKTVSVFQDSWPFNENFSHQDEHPMKIGNKDYGGDEAELNPEIVSEDVESLKKHVLSVVQEATSDHPTQSQVNLTKETSTEKTYSGIGVSEQRRADLLQNLQGFQTLENLKEKLHVRMTPVQSDEAFEMNRSHMVSKQNKKHCENQIGSPKLPTRFVSSVAFEVKSPLFNSISSVYYLPCYPTFSINIEKTVPNQSCDVEFTGYTEDTGMCDFDIFGMTKEEWLTSYTEQESIDRKHDTLYVEGVGLTNGYVGVKNNFQIWTTSGATGCPTVSIYGPQPHCVTETCVVYTGDGLYEVMYEVTHPGYYVISVKWRDIDLQESPYLCKITY